MKKLPGDRAVWGLALTALGLMAMGLSLWHTAGRALEWVPVAAPASVSADARVLESTDVSAAADLSPAWQQPLFSPQRQPDPVLATAQPGAPGMESFSVTGIVLTASLRITMLRQGSEPPVKVREGDQLPNGWSVAAIFDRHVLFKLDNREQTLWLSGAQPPG
ncbi:MAG: hypothetical protein GAK43_02550 [Stenotrophomonas maltophilia]|nr:MAG: hypothetical protein GAK43_02550 [Stenotrophomonas maltophilia]